MDVRYVIGGILKALYSSILIFSLLIVVPLHAAETQCAKEAFGVARFYNLFVLKDLALKNTDTQGFVRVGRNAYLSHYDIGTYFGEMRKMTTEELLQYSNPFGGEGLKSQIHSLKRELPKEMELKGALTVGGNVKISATQVFGAPVLHQGILETGAVKIDYQGKENYSEVPTFHAGEKKISGIDFESTNVKIIELSKRISELKPDKEFRSLPNTQKFELKMGTDKTQNEVAIFEVDAKVLSHARSIVIDAKGNPTVVVNVTGIGGGIVDSDYQLIGVSPQKVLFNFYEAKYLRFSHCSPLKGVFLAPNAFLRFSQMRIEGQLIVGTVYGGLGCGCTKEEKTWIPEFGVKQEQQAQIECDNQGGQMNQTFPEFFTGDIPGVCGTSPLQKQQK
jgi:choice-of-anchor A domain-containing protein